MWKAAPWKEPHSGNMKYDSLNSVEVSFFLPAFPVEQQGAAENNPETSTSFLHLPSSEASPRYSVEGRVCKHNYPQTGGVTANDGGPDWENGDV